MASISDKHLDEFIEISKKEGTVYKTREEARVSAQNLVNFFDVLIKMDMEDRQRKDRLKDEPKGFSMDGEGRNCSLCRRTVYESSGWYDKWGFKCMNCQDAVNKRIIPGSMCGDWKDEKCITDSRLADISKLHVQTIRKLIREGKIKVRKIPKGPNLILRKDNPDIVKIMNDAIASKS